MSIADAQGRPVAQYSYTPYGTVSAADYFQGYNPSVNTIGHHGLFFDNLIEPWKQGLTVYRPQDAVTYTGPDDDGNGVPDIRQVDFAKLTTYGLYQNRNRTYAPVMGRFLQRDPNASGQVTLSDMDWFGGMMPPSPWAGTPDVMGMYGDGMSLHGYAGSNPLGYSDASGLFSYLDIGIGTSTLDGLYKDNADRVMSAGETIIDSMSSKFADYAMEQTLDMFWASDWDSPDDLYRGSATWSSGTGSWAMGGGGEQARSSGQQMAGSVLDYAISNASSRARGLGVYFVYDELGNIIYAGRSTDMARRMASSVNRVGGAYAKGFAMSSKYAVRALEQAAIEGKNLIENGKNVINGISQSNKNGKKYWKALEDFAKKLK